MNSDDFQTKCAVFLMFLLLGFGTLALDNYGGPAGKAILAAGIGLFAAGSTIMVWREVGWRVAIPAALIGSSAFLRELIIAVRSTIPWSEVVPGYPWYLTNTTYYGACIGLFGLGIAFACMAVLSYEPEWLSEWLD